MKKMTTLCLALALTCATEAGATPDKQPKLEGQTDSSMGRGRVQAHARKAPPPCDFSTWASGLPMAAPRAVGNDPISSVTT